MLLLLIVRESPPVPRLAQPGCTPSRLVSGSSSPSQPRQELLCSAAPPGQPFFLDYVVYASCSLSSSGALGRLPWDTQGLFWVGSKVMVKELPKACPL